MPYRLSTTCLTKEELAGFIDGNIIHSRKSRVEDHLLECSLCYDAVLALSEPEASDYLIRIEAINTDLNLKYNSGYHSSKIYYYVSTAAVFLVMLFSYLFYFGENVSGNLFDEYYKPYPNVIPMVRGEGIDFDLKAAMILYNSGNFNDAVIEFDKVLLFESGNETAAFYKAISLMSLNNYEKALPLLRNIHYNPAAQFSDQAGWYEALAYLGMNDLSKTESTLRTIISKNNHFSSKAALLLQKITADE